MPTRTIPQWPQLAVKYIYPEVVRQLPEIAEYLPDPIGKSDKRMPERDFFYKVVNSLRPDIVDSAIEQAIALRKPKGQQLQEQQWAMNVKDEWIDQLLLHDYASCKFLRVLTT